MPRIVKTSAAGKPIKAPTGQVVVELDDPKKTKVFRPASDPYGTGGGGGGGDGGRDGGNEEAILGQIRGIIEGDPMQEFVRQQIAREEGVLGELTGRIQTQEKPEDIYRRLTSQAGIPELQQQASGFRSQLARMQGLLEQLPEDVTSRTAGTLTTEAQRRAILAQEQEPIAKQVSALARALGVTTENLTQQLGGIGTQLELSLRGQEKELEPFRLKLQYLADQGSRLLTGFTADRQSKLDFLMNELNRGRELSDRDWQLAQTLSNQEREYQRRREETLENLYLQQGLKPGTTERSPLGSFLEQEEQRKRQETLADYERQLQIGKKYQTGRAPKETLGEKLEEKRAFLELEREFELPKASDFDTWLRDKHGLDTSRMSLNPTLRQTYYNDYLNDIYGSEEEEGEGLK